MKTRRWSAMILITAVLLMALTPRRAAADFTDGLIIGGIAAGAVAVISIVVGVIAAANSSDEPHFLVPPNQNTPRGIRPHDGVHFGAECPATADGPALMCW